MLSDKVKELIAKSRIVSFTDWQDKYNSEVIAVFQQADDEGRYLNDKDIERVRKIVPQLDFALERGKILRDDANSIVDRARKEVLAAFPSILEPGGGLYPPMRAEACWRDFWHFLRCITYGISGNSTAYISDRGLQYMEELYQELQVPLNAMILGLERLKTFSLNKFDPAERDDIASYFDRLIAEMKKFSPAS